MRLRFQILSALLIVSTAIAQDVPDPKTLPAPPSVAINPRPLEHSEDVAIAIDAIPSDAKYVIYAQIDYQGVLLDPDHAQKAGEGISKSLNQAFALARQRGANLIVLFSNATGVDIPIRQCSERLRLRTRNPVLTAVLFVSKEASDGGTLKRRVRFTSTSFSEPSEAIHYTVRLAKDTAGVTKAYWTYGNISRFVTDAVVHGFDTVALKSTADESFENVWLPGCDEPLRISSTNPILDVTIFKSNGPEPEGSTSP